MSKPKQEDKQMKASMFRIDPELHKQLRIAAIEAGVSMNQAIKEAIEIWLKEQKRRVKK